MIAVTLHVPPSTLADSIALLSRCKRTQQQKKKEWAHWIKIID